MGYSGFILGLGVFGGNEPPNPEKGGSPGQQKQ
jgi:hypothetical protein